MNAPHDLVLVEELEAAAALAPGENAVFLIALAEVFEAEAERTRSSRSPGLTRPGS